LPKRRLIGNNGCHFERGFSKSSRPKKSVDKPANDQPHAAKKLEPEPKKRRPPAVCYTTAHEKDMLFVVLQQ
jgi:hypothetical protein